MSKQTLLKIEQLKQAMLSDNQVNVLTAIVALRCAFRKQALSIHEARNQLIERQNKLHPLILKNKALKYLKRMITLQIENNQTPLKNAVGQDSPPDLLHDFEGEIEKLNSLKRQAITSVEQLAAMTNTLAAKETRIKMERELYGPTLNNVIEDLRPHLKRVFSVYKINEKEESQVLCPALKRAHQNLQNSPALNGDISIESDKTLTLRLHEFSSKCVVMPEIAQIISKSFLPLTIKLHYIEICGCVGINLERRCQFDSHQIFDCLIDGQMGAVMIQAPHTEEERNVNAKFKYYQWLQTLCSQQGISLANSFLNKIGLRIAALKMVEICLEAIRQNQISGILRLANKSKSSICITFSNFHCLSAEQLTNCHRQNSFQTRNEPKQNQRNFQFACHSSNFSIIVQMTVPLNYPNETVRFFILPSSNKLQEPQLPKIFQQTTKIMMPQTGEKHLSLRDRFRIENQVNQRSTGVLNQLADQIYMLSNLLSAHSFAN